jgi:zinc and cadmium transporter
VSVLIVSLISLVGVLTIPLGDKRVKRFLMYFVSFSVGALLGDVFIHLLPEIVEERGFTQEISLYILLSIVVTFVIEKLVHWKHHLDHKGHHHPPLTTMSLIGDGAHNFIDGLVIGASYFISIPVGIATTFAIVLHEIPQEIGNYGVLLHGGYSRAKALLFNLLTALTAVVGVVVAQIAGMNVTNAIPFLSAFAAGSFIYIAAADLIPDLHKEASPKKSAWQFVTMVLGIAAMYALVLLE